MKDLIKRLIDKGFTYESEIQIGIKSFESQIKNILKKHYKTEYVENNFGLTEEFKQYLGLIDGNLLKSNWCYLSSMNNIIKSTDYYYKCNGYLEEGTRMYLHIGAYSDKHDFIYCCDKSDSTTYGKVYDMNDCILHPNTCGDEDYDNVKRFISDLISFI
ncbi:MAG: hypothetical protein N4A72_12955 [Bacteroidales bacterium]|jgi:hypothetical protein|nr:hypothetical protein [Bacteroidales bacterium]